MVEDDVAERFFDAERLEGGNRGGGEECGEKLKTGGREVVMGEEEMTQVEGLGGNALDE